ncbi:sugar ABC transporter substrate-binding protein [Neobacillus notoginsengisoli]|uniref:Sugar ABC transporter substrate-binding protein n=1 Tax=Neobacillus notoginsengisoli TaxID=1578198 RepID=A0A417YIT1_9BACI|nr:ABC transporter substrate-binding protein [Neobacillus notoginsengisoli]RHW32844.1 sugar ABC transporter substrate-binding protein [Neobacillus notoginsengisoli]
MRKFINLFFVVVLMMGLGACAEKETTGGTGKKSKDKKTFGLVVMSTNSDYWITVKNGAKEAVDKIGGELIFTGPATNSDIQEQVSIMENLINSKVDAILLTPLDSDALAEPVNKAMDAGIPVIIIDSIVNTDNYTSFIATDNVAGGEQAMKMLLDSIGEEGKVAIINALAGIPSNDNRGIGAEKYAKKFKSVKLLPQQHSLDQAAALENTENIITANPDLKGIFATFNRGALGAAQAVVNRGKQDDIKIVAYDADPDEIRLLEEGVIDALVVQQPYEMGRLGIEFAVKAMNGEKVEKEVNPEVIVATKENMDDPKVEKVLFPNGK